MQLKNASLSGWASDLSAMFLTANTRYDGTNFRYISTSFACQYRQQSGEHYWYNAASGTAGNPISFTQALTLDASGNLLVGATSGSYHTFNKSSSVALMEMNNSNASPVGLYITFNGASPNGTANEFLTCRDSTTNRAIIRSNGGLANYSANNVNLSDERTKTDIQNAGGYLAKICAIPVRTFKYKDQTDDLLNLGVIAQEVEVVAPELVDASGFGETPEDGVPLKAIYQTDMQYALMKALQELKSEFDAYKAAHP
jgi:hypothetical protein